MSRLTRIGTAILCGLWPLFTAEAVEILLDTTVFESNEETARWSEASTINLDGKNHLFMAITCFLGGNHDHSTAKILGFHSYDGGLTWPSWDQGEVVQENVGKQNTMSPALLKLANSDILCFVNVKNSMSDSGPWVKRSSDGGKRWGELQRLPYEGYGGVGSDRAIQVSTGRVLLPCWVSLDELGSTRVWVFYSDDNGATWKRSPILTTPEGSTGRKTDPAAEEPMIIELKDGRLMMIMRTYLKSIYACYSSDGGETWTEPASSGIPAPGSMSTIRRLPNGDILLVWNHAPVASIDGPWPRRTISAAISKDDGKNFTSVRRLDGADDFGGKITMANVVFTGEGNVVISYSKSMTMKNAYNWRVQVMPQEWFYEGDTSVVYGETYLPILEQELAASRKPVTPKTDRPTPEARAKALAGPLATFAAEDGKEIDLVAAYHFETDEAEFAFDTSKNANDLTFTTRNGSPHWADGIEGRSVQFDGKIGILAAPHSESLTFPTGQFTVEAQVYPTAFKKHSLIVTKEHMFEVGLLNGQLKAAVMTGGKWGPAWLGSREIPLNEWSRIAVTFDGRRMRFYVNGKRIESKTRIGKMDQTDELLVVGGCTNINDATFAGHIDELKLWRTVRYDEQTAARPLESREPRPVGQAHQLFIDDELSAAIDGLERVVNHPRRHVGNPVLTYEYPWEGNCVITWGSVLYDAEEERFKVWYEVYKKFSEQGDNMLLCYATSENGIDWEKPSLGVYEYPGCEDNNIVFWEKGRNFDAPTVLPVPDPTPDCKYRLYFHDSEYHGIRTGVSADGIHWDVPQDVVLEAGDRNTVRYDPIRKKYRIITRIPGRGQRTCGLWESSDGEHFEAVGELLASDEDDPAETELYGMIEFQYGSLYLGFLEPFFIPTRKLNTQLAYSRDGVKWHRACDRQTFLEYGPPGAWDQAWVTPSHNPPIRVGDTLYIFYQGRQTLHWAAPPYGHIGGVGLAFLRPDGFVSLDSQWEEGCVTTAPLILDGEALHINAFARPGYVTAEITDAEGNTLGGFSRDDCMPLEMTDSLDHAFAWKSGETLSSLNGAPVRINFYVRGAKLYSFWVN